MIRRKKYIGEKPNKMLVISLDAVGCKDLAVLETLPNFKRLLTSGAVCRHVKSVYPSLTYPAHVSIVTGKLPARHGIVNNLQFQPNRENPDWFWQRRFIRGTTLYDEARKAGLKTASLLWPVTGRAGISCNLPEVWSNRPWENQLMASFLNGTPWYQWDLYKRYGHLLDGIRQPMLDNFVQASLLRTLSHYRPDLTMVHFTDVDTIRHEYGVDSKEAEEALKRHDMRLGEIFGLIERLGETKTTNIIVLGDHFQKNVNQVLYPNYYIVEKGWAKRKGNRLVKWNVAAQTCDGACYIYLKNRKDKEGLYQVALWLKEWKKRPGSGIRAVYSGKQAREKGADPRCSFMLEAEDGVYFKNGCREPLRKALKGNGVHRGAHGYNPDSPDYETFFLASGPDFQPGIQVSDMYLIDEGPIMARALGLELEDADGAVIDQFFLFGN